VKALAVMAATGAAALSAPVIHERFTPLPCPRHPSSTVDLEGCLERSILRADAAIDGRAKTIFFRLRPGSARAAFVRGEHSWLRYRNATCTAQASTFAGGSGQPVVYARCLLSRDRRHLADLAELGRAVRPGG
jgi:uncharacterized protein YecT (DUF1311 family)